MENPKISLPGIITKITTMSDGGLRVQVDTQEINPSETSTLFELKGKTGYFFFDEVAIRQVDTSKLPEIQLEEGEKPPSQRLRAVLYVYWEQNKIKESFDIFYRRQVGKWIESIKEKLA